MRRLVVSNTGPLLHLGEAQAFELLELTGDVFIPDAVYREIASLDPTREKPVWLNVRRVGGPHVAEAISWQQAGLFWVLAKARNSLKQLFGNQASRNTTNRGE